MAVGPKECTTNQQLIKIARLCKENPFVILLCMMTIGESRYLHPLRIVPKTPKSTGPGTGILEQKINGIVFNKYAAHYVVMMVR